MPIFKNGRVHIKILISSFSWKIISSSNSGPTPLFGNRTGEKAPPLAGDLCSQLATSSSFPITPDTVSCHSWITVSLSVEVRGKWMSSFEAEIIATQTSSLHFFLLTETPTLSGVEMYFKITFSQLLLNLRMLPCFSIRQLHLPRTFGNVWRLNFGCHNWAGGVLLTFSG